MNFRPASDGYPAFINPPNGLHNPTGAVIALQPAPRRKPSLALTASPEARSAGSVFMRLSGACSDTPILLAQKIVEGYNHIHLSTIPASRAIVPWSNSPCLTETRKTETSKQKLIARDNRGTPPDVEPAA